MLIDGEPRLLPVFDGRDEFPTYVAFNADGGRLVGLAAKRQAVINPANTIFTIKRLIGRKFANQETQDELGLLPYRIVPSTAGYLWIEAGGRSYTPTESTAIMLAEARRATEMYLDSKVTGAVITVPAYFDESQKRATMEAARIAGLDYLRLVAEPTAAALAARFGGITPETVGVYDLGGGTFDFSILEIGGGVFEVKAVAGNNRLGGEDFDHVLVRHFVQMIKHEYNVDLSGDALALHRIKDAAEKIKIQLDVAQYAVVSLPYLSSKHGSFFHVELKLTREDMVGLVRDLIDQTLVPCQRALKDAWLTAKDLNSLLLVGGMSRMPEVRRRVSEYFGIVPEQHHDPSRIVALGAAVLAGMIGSKDMLLLDVIPMSLGIEMKGGVFHRIIDRNTTIPTKNSLWRGKPVGSDPDVAKLFEHFRHVNEIKVFQGEREFAKLNLLLSEIPIPASRAPRDKAPSLDITIDIDARGLMTVSVENKATGEVNSETIEVLDPFARIVAIRSDEEIAAARAQADELLNIVDAALMAHRDHIHADTLRALDEAREGLRRAMQSRDGTELAGALAALSAVSSVKAPSWAAISPGRSRPVSVKATTMGRSVFVSYARPDRPWLDRLRVYLVPLERDGRVEIWHDGRIETGTSWEFEIENALAKSSAAILLISANFMASSFIYDHELPPILERNRAHGLSVLPVIIGHCLYTRDPALSRLNTFNDPQRPFSALTEGELDAEFARLAYALWTLLEPL
jgi:molecular chaperone DnaK